MPGFAETGTLASALADSLANGTVIDDRMLIDAGEGISLLTLKNQALLSYLHNLALVATSQVLLAHPKHDSKLANQMMEYGRQATATQRVVIERGIKGLESKLSYQLEKAVRAYRKEQDRLEQAREAASANSDNEEEDSDEEEEDPTKYKPNVRSLLPANRDSDDESEGDDDPKHGKKYQAPKIAATALGARPRRRMRNFAMEEYLRESSEAPTAEPSIGSAIMDHGRGGERTEHERRKQQEIDDYEESNFTRLQAVSSKQARRDARKRAVNASTRSLFGEDWGFVEENGQPGTGRSGSKRLISKGKSRTKRRKH